MQGDIQNLKNYLRPLPSTKYNKMVGCLPYIIHWQNGNTRRSASIRFLWVLCRLLTKFEHPFFDLNAADNEKKFTFEFVQRRIFHRELRLIEPNIHTVEVKKNNAFLKQPGNNQYSSYQNCRHVGCLHSNYCNNDPQIWQEDCAWYMMPQIKIKLVRL